MKTTEYHRAILLRQKGLTYPEIQTQLNVSKGSLSRWLRSVAYEPSPEKNLRRKLANAATGRLLHQRKLDRVRLIMNSTAKDISFINRTTLHWLGIMAYWAEGSKTQDNQVAFTNTDSALIRLVRKWWMECCGVDPKRIRLHIRVHDDKESRMAERYWRKAIGIPKRQCYKTTIKPSGSLSRRANKIRFGIATIKVCDTDLYYRIRGWIEGLRTQIII